jgi:hypothetical protein
MLRCRLKLQRVVITLTTLLLAVPAALAHTKSTTYSSWQIVGRNISAAFTVPMLESARLARAGEEQPPNEVLIDYLTQHLSVTANGNLCRYSLPPRALAATQQFRRFEMKYECASATDITLHNSAFFEMVPTHVSLAQIETPNGGFVEQLFSIDSQAVATTGDGENRMRNAGFIQYVGMGINHILTGVDHLSFLVGLVLISRRLRDLIFVVTGFTLGHSATLALAVTGVLRPHAEYIDALVALTIALIGVENIVVATHRPLRVAWSVGGVLVSMAVMSLFGLVKLPATLLLGAGIFSANYLMLSGHLRDAARLRLVATLVFGLIHGFGFAADLLEMRLPVEKLVAILLGFNLGVEIGQLSLVLLLLGSVALLVRMKMRLPRPVVVDVTAAGLVALGTYWFINRSVVF